jgi:hypothetical protein
VFSTRAWPRLPRMRVTIWWVLFGLPAPGPVVAEFRFWFRSLVAADVRGLWVGPAGPLRGIWRGKHPGLPGLTSLLRLALVFVSESPEPPVFRPHPVKGGVRVDAASASPKHAMRRRRRFPSSSANPSDWPARGPCGIGAARATPAGSRARPGPGRTEAPEQWTESDTEYQRVDCGRSSCAAVYRRPAHGDVYCWRGPKVVGLWSGIAFRL